MAAVTSRVCAYTACEAEFLPIGDSMFLAKLSMILTSILMSGILAASIKGGAANLTLAMSSADVATTLTNTAAPVGGTRGPTTGRANAAEPARAQRSTGIIVQVVDRDNDPYSGIYLRRGRSMNEVDRINSNYVPYGTSVELICGAWGEAVGPNANRRWHNVRVANGANTNRVGWLPDRYLTTSNYANQPTPGEPECGSSQPPAPPAVPRVWAGSPIDGCYDCGDPADGPGTHHFMRNSDNPEHDLAFDIGAPAGRDVLVYFAPEQNHGDVYARVDRVGATCGSVARGGGSVTVGVYTVNGNARIASITYAHINPSVRVGDRPSRWGGKVGTIAGGLRPDAACWTGPHVHLEMWAASNYACWHPYAHNASIRKSNYIGHLTGNSKTGIRQRC